MDTRSLLDLTRSRFADTLSTALGRCGLRLPAIQQVIRREAASAFEELAELRSYEDYQRKRGLNSSRISLVHLEDMDLTVALINLSNALRDACERELPRLQTLFMRLLDQQSAVADQLPVGPEAVCIAMRGICDSGEIPELRLQLPELAQDHLVAAMMELYPELSQTLSDHGVEPASLVRLVSNSSAGTVASNRQAFAQDVFASGPPGAYASAQVAATPRHSTLEGPLGRLQERLMQRHPASAAPSLDPALLQAIMERVFTWLTERQHAGRDDAAVNLSELRALLPATSNAALEALGVCFDVLAADSRLCPPVRADLDRLRLSVGKAALIDGKFPADHTHPPRRLLEVVLRLGYSLPPQTTDSHPVCQAIDAAILRLQKEFDRDIACFATAAATLEALENRALRAQTDRCAGLLGIARSEAQREHSRHHAARAIRALCADGLPRPIRIFLEQLWVRVLAVIHQHGDGDKSGAWIKALRTANKLVESVQLHADAAMRKMQQARLPVLMNELRAGLEAVGTPEALRERAFRSFVNIHSAVLEGRKPTEERGGDIMIPSPPRLDGANGHPGAFVLRLPPAAEPEARSGWIGELEVGDWLEIELPDREWRRLRLMWMEGNPMMLLGCSFDSDFRLIFPARWLQNPDGARRLPMRGLFDRAVEAAEKRSSR